MSDYYLMYTRPAMEYVAMKSLAASGVESYLPQFLRPRRHARKFDVVPSPLFPRYLFVLVSSVPSVRLLRSARGASDMVRQGIDPSIVRGDVVRRLKAQQGADGFIDIDEPSHVVEYQPGEKLRVSDGTFYGLVAQFIRMTTAERARVAVQLIGRLVEIDMDTSNLERVA